MTQLLRHPDTKFKALKPGGTVQIVSLSSALPGPKKLSPPRPSANKILSDTDPYPTFISIFQPEPNYSLTFFLNKLLSMHQTVGFFQ